METAVTSRSEMLLGNDLVTDLSNQLADADFSMHDVRELVIADACIEDVDLLVGQLEPRTDLWRVDSKTDIACMFSAALSGAYERIHVLAHGQPGAITLGGKVLEVEDFTAFSCRNVKVQSMHFWSCMTGEGVKGRAFVDGIAQVFDTLVTAFSGLVGASSKGGSWFPDVCSRGKVLAVSPFYNTVAYAHTLQTNILELKAVRTAMGVDLQVWLKAGTVVDAADLVLSYDPARASYTGALPNSELGWAWLPNQDVPGHLLIGGYSGTMIPVNSPADVLLETVSFTLAAGTAEFSVAVTSDTGLSNGDLPVLLGALPIVTYVPEAVNSSPTGGVTITGTPQQGEALTADTSTLGDADGLGALHYQWQAGGVDISGATGSTLALTESEVNKTINVIVNYTDGHNTAEVVPSSATGAVANLNDLPTGGVTITGTAKQGSTLIADTITLGDVDGLGTLHYQWQAGGVDIPGATGSTFVLGAGQVGRGITVNANYTDGHGTIESVQSSVTSSVAPQTYAVTVQTKYWNNGITMKGVGLETALQTDATGSVKMNDRWGVLTLTPAFQATSTAKSQVDLLDAITILKSIVGLTSLNAYQAIAADFDKVNGVDLNDAIGILKHVVGLPSATPEWVFLNKVVPIPHAADPITVDVIADTTVELVGILRGDVNGSWLAG